MPRTKISEFSATPGNNTDIDGINLAEGCAPSGINDAIRELMAQLKDFQAGTAGDSFNGPIGTTTPAAGVFTNLSASGTFALTGDQVQISEGGTGQTTANAAFNALAPSQTSQAGKYLKTDGTNTSWDAIDINTADITGTLPIANGGTGLTALGTGVQTALGQNVTGSGGIVLASSPSLTTPNLGTPSAVTLTNATGLPLSTGVTGTLATTNGGTGLTSFTANGVVYASSSSVLTTGSALTFDGSNLTLQSTNTAVVFNNSSATPAFQVGYIGGTNRLQGRAVVDAPMTFYVSDSEQMRLTSTGLGIGTSSPLQQLHLSSASATGMQITYQGVGAARIGVAAGNLLNFGLDTSNGTTTRMTLDSSGNLGLGVTPSAWVSNQWSVFEGAYGGALAFYKASNVPVTVLTSNAYNDGGWKYKTTDPALQYEMDGNVGIHKWYNAPSGTAGNAISFTQAMTLTAAGDLGVGTTTPDIFGRFYTRSIGFSSSGTTGLQVNGSTYGTVDVGAGGTRTGNFVGSSTEVQLGTVTSIPLLLVTNGSERARITSSGNFGLGTTDPDYGSFGATERILGITGVAGNRGRLSLQNTSTGTTGVAGTIAFFNGSTQLASFEVLADGATNRGYYVFNTNNGTSNAERARITSDGNLLVGTTSADGKTTINTSSNQRNIQFNATDSSTYTEAMVYVNGFRNTTNGTWKYLSCAINGVGEKLQIIDSGTVNNATGTYGTISDARLKQDIVDAGSQWDDLKAIRFRKYRMKTDVEANPDAPALLGVVAQELEQVCPGLVDESNNEDGSTTKTVKSSILLMKAAVALQEAMARIEQLEAKVAALEAK